MKYLIIALLFCSCSAKWHVNRAIKKDPTIKSEVIDTVQFSKTIIDTIHTSDSTYYIEHRTVHFDTVVMYQQYNFSGLKTWFETMQENKTERTKIRTFKKVTKSDNKTNRYIAKQERKEANNGYKTAFFICACILLFIIVSKLIAFNSRK